MFKRLQSHLQWRNDLLLSGRYEDLALTYVLPQVIYLGGDIVKLTDMGAATRFLRGLHGNLTQRGIKSGRVRVIAVGLPARGRFKVWLATTFAAPTGESSSQAVYYMIDTTQGLRSEMMEFASSDQLQSQSLRQGRSSLI